MEKRVQLYAGEVRASKTGNKMRVSGYAARYNVLSNPLGSGEKKFRERIAKRAFDGVLADPNLDCVMTFNHSMDAVLGRTSSGTLRLRGDDQGLAFDCDLANTQLGRDTYELVQRGDLPGMSFAFELGERDEDWDEEEIEDEKDLGLRGRVVNAVRKWAVRTIKSFRRLHDVSIVACPAYPGTQIDARNLVAAECRSHVDKLTAPRLPVYGVYSGDAADELIAQRRRKRMLDAVLD
jgi:HK97 family phage prohead protease